MTQCISFPNSLYVIKFKDNLAIREFSNTDIFFRKKKKKRESVLSFLGFSHIQRVGILLCNLGPHFLCKSPNYFNTFRQKKDNKYPGHYLKRKCIIFPLRPPHIIAYLKACPMTSIVLILDSKWFFMINFRVLPSEPGKIELKHLVQFTAAFTDINLRQQEYHYLQGSNPGWLIYLMCVTPEVIS